MKDLLKRILRSQTVLGFIPFLVFSISDFAIFGFQQSSYNDRDVFNCVPRLNASTELCYDKYTSERGLKFYFLFMPDGFLFVIWIYHMVQSTRYLWKTKRNRLIQNEDSQQSVNSPLNWSPDKFWRMQLMCLGLHLVCVGIATTGFCYLYFIESKYAFSSPTVYKCSLATDTTPVTFNQTFSCYDQLYKEKANFNIATVVIRLIIIVLYLINFIYIVKAQPNELLDKLLGDVVEEGGSNINLQGETTNLYNLCRLKVVFFIIYLSTPNCSNKHFLRPKSKIHSPSLPIKNLSPPSFPLFAFKLIDSKRTDSY